MVTMERELTPSQAARVIGVSHQWIINLCNQGRLPHRRTPLGRLVDAAAVEELARARAQRMAAIGAA